MWDIHFRFSKSDFFTVFSWVGVVLKQEFGVVINDEDREETAKILADLEAQVNANNAK